MLGYHHILLATDLSDKSEKVAKRALALAKNNHAKLSMVHVMEHSPVVYGGEFSIPIDIDLETLLEKHARESMAKLSKMVGGVAIDDQYLEVGAIKHVVTTLANKIGADLILVGAHGHHGIDRLLGSRANAILHAAKCDVWVVKV